MNPKRIVSMVVFVCAVGAWLWLRRAPKPPAPRPTAPAAQRAEQPSDLPVWARDPDAARGAIAGRVQTPEGQPVAGALVGALIDSGDLQRADKPTQTTSAADGTFLLSNLAPGTYGASASADTFAGGFADRIAVLPGRTTSGIALVMAAGGVRVSGVVNDEGGGPVPNAEVRIVFGLTGSKQHRMALARAKTDGTFALQLSASGMQTATADADGYAPQTKFVDTRTERTLSFSLSPAARLTGVVKERGTGAPVAGARVVVEKFPSSFFAKPSSAQSRADGTYEITDLDPGQYHVSAQKGSLTGRLSAPLDVRIAERTVAADLELHQGLTVRGRVVGTSGAPVAAARVHLGLPPAGLSGRSHAETGADGSFVIEGVSPERYLVRAEAPGHAPTRQNVAVTDRDPDPLTLSLKAETIVDGQVLTADGAPAADVTVTAIGNDSFMASGVDRTGADGKFRVTGLPPSALTLMADGGDRGRTKATTDAVKEGETKTLTLTLEKGATIEGHVSFDDGKPAAGAQVMAMTLGAALMPVTATTDAEGAYSLVGLSAGSVDVVASRKTGPAAFAELAAQGKNRSKVTLAENEVKTGVNLVVLRGGKRIEGVVLDPDGKPAAGAQVRAMAGRGARMAALFGGAEKPAVAGDDGRFVCEDLSEGRYIVTAHRAGLPDAEKTDVAAGTTGVELRFAKAAAVAGTAVDERGRPLPGFSARTRVAQKKGSEPSQADRARQMMEMMSTSAQTFEDATGAFEVTGLAAGTYEVVVTVPDGRTGVSEPLNLAAGQRRDGLRITVSQGLTVHGQLVAFETGAPVAGQMVLPAEAMAKMTTSDDKGMFSVSGLAPAPQLTIMVGGAVNGDRMPEPITVKPTPGERDIDLKIIRMVKTAAPGAANPGLSLKRVEGAVVIRGLVPGGAAAQAGLTEGTRVLTLDGRPLDGVGEVGLSVVTGGPADSEMRLGIADGNGERTVTLKRTAAVKTTVTASGK